MARSSLPLSSLLVLALLSASYAFDDCPTGNAPKQLILDGAVTTDIIKANEWRYYQVELPSVKALVFSVKTGAAGTDPVDVYFRNSSCPTDTAFTERLRGSFSGHYEIGMNDQLVVKPGTWILGVKGDSSITGDLNIQISAVSGAAACTTPAADESQFCSDYITYPVLNYRIGDDAEEAQHEFDRLKTTSDCNAELKKVLCYKAFFRCDKSTGMAIKPCPSVCTGYYSVCNFGSSVDKTAPVRAICEYSSANPNRFGFPPSCWRQGSNPAADPILCYGKNTPFIVGATPEFYPQQFQIPCQ